MRILASSGRSRERRRRPAEGGGDDRRRGGGGAGIKATLVRLDLAFISIFPTAAASDAIRYRIPCIQFTKKKTNNGVPAQKRNPVFGNTPRSVDRQQATVLTLALSY